MPSPAGLLRLTVAGGLLLAGCRVTGEVAEPTPSGPAPSDPAATAHVPGLPTSEPATSEPATSEPATSEPTTTQQPDPGQVIIAFVGDVMLGRSVGERILAGQDPFAGVAAQLASADLVVGTLETTVGQGGTPQDKAFTFQAPPEAVDALLAGGFDLVALANNHSFDYGAEGLTGTVDLLNAGGLAHIGAGADAEAARAPVILSEGGVETAFLSYVDVPDDWTGYRNRDWEAGADRPGVAWAHPDHIAADVARVRPEVDHVVVLIHAGVEGSTEPSDVQRAAADAAIEAGATAVIGGHPHVLQGSRLEDGAFTAWSLGNFVFDGFGDDPVASQSAILTLTLDRDGIEGVAWTPVEVVDAVPETVGADGELGRAILDRVAVAP